MKNNIKTIIVGIVCFAFGLSFVVVSYANSYRSEEISYDNSTSHASATNVKDAIDYLYSHGSCGEGMSCLESPTITINVVGDGSIDKNSMIIPISGSNKIKVTPQNSYTLGNIECTNNYQISSYNVSREEQEIEITNPGVVVGSTCTVRFDAPVEVDIGSSTYLNSPARGDSCYEEKTGCICFYMYKYESDSSTDKGKSFSYGSHTGCNFKSKKCIPKEGNNLNQQIDCTSQMGYNSQYSFYFLYEYIDSVTTYSNRHLICSGVL